MPQIENGKYDAHAMAVVVGEHSNGCLIVSMEMKLDESGIVMPYTAWVTTKDRSVNTKAVESLKDVFGWPGDDPFWFEDNANEVFNVPVELVIENESFVGNDGVERTHPKIKWVNKPGFGSGSVAPTVRDRKSLLSKYGGKLRAISGGNPAVAPAKKAMPPPPPPTQPELPPASPTAPPSTLNDCWAALCEQMGDKDRKEIENAWKAIVQSVHGDKSQTDFTQLDWGLVLKHIKENLPF
jgi:hypothetical protein